MKRKIEFSNFGFSTILLCFVMICVVTFSALSLVSAYSDYKLSKKVADKTADYYEAEAKAYEKLAAIDTIAVTAYQRASSMMNYYSILTSEEVALAQYGSVYTTMDGLCVCFTETVSEDHFLQVTILIDYPTEDNRSLISVIEWRSYYEKTPPDDDILDLIQ